MTEPRNKTFRAACIQNSAGKDPAENLKRVLSLVGIALKLKPDVVALPENFYWRGSRQEMAQVAYQTTPEVIRTFRLLAQKSRTAFVLGSVIEPSHSRTHFYNTLVHIGPSGRIQSTYRKIHLFDVQLPRGISIRESDTTKPGREIVTALVGGRRAGFSICYDLRFPELFRALARKGSRMIFLPANFTKITGQAHWEVLLRARAIENQVFMIAPAQTGRHPVTGIASYGSSMIVDPWGRVLSRATCHREEVISAEFDWTEQAALRDEFPVLRHSKLLARR